ncbi:hypothetical protein F4779DRAFT_561628 [Xylariaceae sp. FL0662B]|nr:hypothetical protein F4779DRAFT_561628 [Xylariaceae sp. FL0662B]
MGNCRLRELGCPSKGKFYVCDSAKIRFIGCCTIDPCADGSGRCPQASLAPASFSSDHYNSIPAQSCAAPNNSSKWFTCKTSQPFLGCCNSNPCQNGGCPTKDILPARLSDNPNDAQVFLSASQPSSTPAPSNAATPTGSRYTLPLGGILGIALGGAALVAILMGFVICRRRRGARRKKQEADSDDQPAQHHSSTYSPAYATHWQEQQPLSHASSPHANAFPSPGYTPYSPGGYLQPQPQPQAPAQSSPPPEHWPSSNSGHVSGSSWNSVAASIAQRQSQTPLLPLPTELEGRETQRPAVAELPSTPAGSSKM